MEKNKKVHIYYLFLGIGIGLVLGSIINILNPNVKYKEYTEAEIREEAKNLGMRDLDEIFEMNEQFNEQIEKKLEKKTLKEENPDSEAEGQNKTHENKEEDMEEDINEASVEANSDEATATEYIEFEVKKGDPSQTIIDNLYEAKIIDDKEKFEDAINNRKATKKLNYGIFQFEKGVDNIDYDTIIDILTK